MGRRATIAGIVALAIVSASPAAARSGDDDDRARAPRAWAADVCEAITDWSGGIELAVGSVDATSSTDPVDVRDALARLLKTTGRETLDATRALRDIGRPTVPKGARIAGAVVDTFAEVADRLRDERRTLLTAPTSDAAALSAANEAATNAVGTAIDAAVTSIGAATVLRSTKLDRALRASSSCRAIVP